MDIYDEYDKLLKYCYMKTNDSFLAEDLVQEAFVKYFSNPPKHSNDAPNVYVKKLIIVYFFCIV